MPLFSIGHIEVLCAEEHIEFCLSAPEVWRCPVEAVSESSRVDTPLKCWDRSVPAWRLSWHIFNKLVQGFCYFRKIQPVKAALFTDPAAGELCREMGGSIRQQPQQDLFLSLTFDSIATKSPSVDPHPGTFITHFTRLVESGHGQMVCAPDRTAKSVSEWVNPEWWEANHYPISEDGIEYID